MNLIDFHVTQITGPIRKIERDWGDYWLVPVEYWDDGGSGQTTELMCSSEAEANAIKTGYIGQH